MRFPLSDIFEGEHGKKLMKGQIIIYEGDPITDLYYIRGGYIKVYNILSNGARTTIFIYGPEDIFPLRTVLSGSTAARYFYESMSEVELMSVSVQRFTSKIINNLEDAEQLIKYTTYINEQFTQRIDMLAVNDAKRKVVALISFLVGKLGSDEAVSHIELPLTQQDIADMCGLTRETTSIQLTKLRKSKVITSDKDLIVDTAKMRKLRDKLTIPSPLQ
jgi:CRP/FNR family transcriptional regulator